MELSRPAVMQHHGHFTLTLAFQGQMLKKAVSQELGADWRKGTKGMWVDRMLDPLFYFELWRQPWPVIFKVKLWKKP